MTAACGRRCRSCAGRSRLQRPHQAKSGAVPGRSWVGKRVFEFPIPFEQLGAESGLSPKSLIRMFGPRGNPQARNLFAVLGHLQKHAGLTLHVTVQAQ